MPTNSFNPDLWIKYSHPASFLTPVDLSFINQTLSLSLSLDSPSLLSSLNNPSLFHRLISEPHTLLISSPLYFYILSHHSLSLHNLNNPSLSFYLSTILSLPQPPLPPYFSDSLSTINNTPNPSSQFSLRINFANHLLLLTSIFLDHLSFRSQRFAAPSPSFLSSLALSQFSLLSSNPLAQKYELLPILLSIQKNFTLIQSSLHQLASEFTSLGDPPPPPFSS